MESEAILTTSGPIICPVIHPQRCFFVYNLPINVDFFIFYGLDFILQELPSPTHGYTAAASEDPSTGNHVVGPARGVSLLPTLNLIY